MKTIWILNHYAGQNYNDKGGRHFFLGKYFNELGYNTIIFCANSNHWQGGSYFEMGANTWEKKVEEQTGVTYIFVKTREYVGNGKTRILNMLDYYYNVKKAMKEVQKELGTPDVIIGSSVHPLACVAAIKMSKKFCCRNISEIRDLWPESIVEYSDKWKDNNPIIRLLYKGEKWIYTHTDGIVFLDDGDYEYIKEKGWEKDIPEEKVFYISNGVDLPSFNHNRDNYCIKDDDLDDEDVYTVVYTGTINRVNNLGLLIDAAKLIKNKSIRILVWGRGEEVEMLKERVANEAVENVVFKGFISKEYIPYITSKADLNLVHNSPSPLLRFGLSFNKIYDYLAAGKPILCDFPSKFNPVIESKAGVDIITSSPEEIANAIEMCYSMEKRQREQMCINAKKAAVKYDYKVLAAKYLKILDAF